MDYQQEEEKRILERDAIIDVVHSIILSHIDSNKDGAFSHTDYTLLTVNKEICGAIRALSYSPELESSSKDRLCVTCVNHLSQSLNFESNVKAILECNFAGFKDEIIETACKLICDLQFDDPHLDIIIDAIQIIRTAPQYLGSDIAQEAFEDIIDIITDAQKQN
jgi:hypothetical protein